MRERFRMFRRGNTYYCQDNVTAKQESLRTSSYQVATQRICHSPFFMNALSSSTNCRVHEYP